MPEPPTITAAGTAPGCLHCGYDLRGSPTDICPECGKVFDPVLRRHRRLRRWFISLAAMIIVMYSPFSWLVFVEADPSYRNDWLKIAPVLPGFVPTRLASALTSGRPLSDGLLIVIAALV